MLVPLNPELGDIITVPVSDGWREECEVKGRGCDLAAVAKSQPPLNLFASVYINHCV